MKLCRRPSVCPTSCVTTSFTVSYRKRSTTSGGWPASAALPRAISCIMPCMYVHSGCPHAVTSNRTANRQA